jgi:peptide/nickel transport system permease protein
MMRTGILRSRGAITGVVILAALALCGVLASRLAPGDPFAVASDPLLPPTKAHPFGTDDLGRDVYAGVMHGASNSLRVGVAAAAISALAGLVVGGLAGARRGSTDRVLMGATEFVQSVPRFFLVVTIVSLFGGSLSLIVLIIGLTAWPGIARLFRAQVQSTFGRDFVSAARAAGAGDGKILVRHVLPAAVPVLAAEISYQAGGAILAEAGLSFLGLGDPAVMSWGTLLGAAQHFVRDAWWMSVFPGVAVTLTVLACNLVADALVETPSH